MLLLVYSVLHDEIFFESIGGELMQLRRLMIVLAICIVGLVVAALGMYRSWQNFTSGGLFGILSSHGHYMMVDGTSTTVTLDS